MSNREENLQRINAELEKLSDEELNQVAGGTVAQTTADQTFLYKYGLTKESGSNDFWTFIAWLDISRAVDVGWSKAGITCVTKPFYSNQYFFEGREISRETAIKIVEDKFKKIREA